MASPCNNSPDEVIEKIVSAKANADKFDKFVNGTNTQTVQLGSGSPTPTIRNAVRQIKADGEWIKQFIADAPEGDVSLNNVTALGSITRRTLAERFSDIINVKDFGAKGDGVTPDSTAIQAAIDAAYDIGTAVFFPSGTYVIDQTLTVSGVYLYGVIGAYAADNGTVLMGATGAETIMQTRTSPTAKDITFGLSGLRLTNCAIGCDFGYVTECDFEDISIESSQNAFQLGRHDEYMPLFNTFKGCRFKSTNGHALALDGSNGCNSNSFYNCTFRIDGENSSAIRFYASGGYGSINNVFYQCEITGNGIGLYNFKSQNTSLYQCYMENYKTAIYLATASNLSISRCVFGSLRGQGESYIYFPEGGTIVVDGATLYPRIYEEDKNQYFIGFNENSTATKVVYIKGNVIIATSPIGFNRYQPNLFKDTIVSQYGRIVIRRRNQASVAATLSNGTTGIRIRCNGIDGSESTATGAIDFNESTAIAFYPNLDGECGPVAVAGKNFRPSLQADDGILNLGMASYRWNVVYAATGAIDTSDARLKTGIVVPSEALMRAWGKISFKVFQFKDAISKKGDSARLHTGLIAQEVDEAFKSEGLDASQYGLFCYDEWDDEWRDEEVVDSEAVYNEIGEIVSPQESHIEHRLVCKAGNRYGIRYEEALALECAYQRWLGEKRDARIAELEARLNEISGNSTAPSGASPNNL